MSVPVCVGVCVSVPVCVGCVTRPLFVFKKDSTTRRTIAMTGENCEHFFAGSVAWHLQEQARYLQQSSDNTTSQRVLQHVTHTQTETHTHTHTCTYIHVATHSGLCNVELMSKGRRRVWILRYPRQPKRHKVLVYQIKKLQQAYGVGEIENGGVSVRRMLEYMCAPVYLPARGTCVHCPHPTPLSCCTCGLEDGKPWSILWLLCRTQRPPCSHEARKQWVSTRAAVVLQHTNTNPVCVCMCVLVFVCSCVCVCLIVCLPLFLHLPVSVSSCLWEVSWNGFENTSLQMDSQSNLCIQCILRA